MPRLGGVLGGLAVAPWALCGLLSAQAPPDFEACGREASPARQAYCLYTASPGAGAEAESRLLDLRGRYPDEPYVPFYLALLGWSDSARAERYLAEAASRFAARNRPEEEVNALAMRLRLLSTLGRAGEAAGDVARVAALEPELEALEVQVAARLMRVRYLIAGARDYAAAQDLLLAARESSFPAWPIPLQEQWLLDQGDAALALGRFEAAADAYGKLSLLARTDATANGPHSEAQALYGELRVLREQSGDAPTPGAREAARDLAERTLEAARRAGSRDVEAKALQILGLVTAGEEARRHLKLCVEIAQSAGDRSACLSALARILSPGEPKLARRAADRALDLAREASSPAALIYALREQVRLAWRLGAPEAAWAASRSDLATLEALRDLQPGALTQSQVFSMVSPHFYLLSGALLRDHAESGREESLERAFEIVERFRARSLNDRLERMRGAPRPSPEAAEIERQRGEVLRRISDLQRPLFAAGAAAGSLAELGRLETQVRRLEERLARTDPPLARLRGGFATLERIRGALGPDEALLSFQIGPWEDMQGDFAGGAWLVAVSRRETRVLPLRSPLVGRAALRDAVRFFSGLVERHDGAEGPAAGALYDALLAQGLEALGPTVRKLVLIPDDALHLLPFGALRPAGGGLPLASRFDLAIAPSASLWLRWRSSPPASPAGAPALVFADPQAPGGTGRETPGAVSDRAAIFARTFRLGPLPGARREGRNAAERLGEGSELYVGSGASEASLKARLARPFGLLHLAAHAVVDEGVPERSGILLAAGEGGEDGLLQVREIAGLRLDGKVVVLSACRTAGGSVLRGEGVMGLARAFFQAGAHTVVASLWPLDDEAGAALFEPFYRELAAGKSVAEALRRAQEGRIAGGAPAFDWAGVVVLGDGDVVPLPGGAKGARPLSRAGWSGWGGKGGGAALGGLLLAAALAGASTALWRRRRRRSRPEGPV